MSEKFVPRPYQEWLMKNVRERVFRKFIANWSRRSGKDITAFNIAIEEAIRKPSLIYIVGPTYPMIKRGLWNGVTIEGCKLISYLPNDIAWEKNNALMRIKIGDSTIKFLNSDNFKYLLEYTKGETPDMIIFSEYALHNEYSSMYLQTILNKDTGVQIYFSTHILCGDKCNIFHKLWKEAMHSQSEDLVEDQWCICGFESCH